MFDSMMGMGVEQFIGLIVVIGVLSSPINAEESNVTANVTTDFVQYLDRFNYDVTTNRTDGFKDFGPKDWGDIECDEENALSSCLAYRDIWETGRQWGIQKNYCKWCPIDGTGGEECQRHHQSPINLQRAVGYEPDTHPLANECIDVHWMKYEDSFCSFDQLQDKDAFTIERHALRITQPVEVYANFSNDLDGVVDGVRSMCYKKGRGSRFGRIDFSKGFSHWWFLSHTDIHLPSEHTQEGVRYDGEIQLHHFYSVNATYAEVNNEVATVSIFLQAYDDAAPFAPLDRVICEWRRKEYEVRTECGLQPIQSTYPGCFPLQRRERGRNLRHNDKPQTEKASSTTKFQTVHDVILHNDKYRYSTGSNEAKLHMEENNWAPAEEKDWSAWIAEQSQRMNENEAAYHKMREMEHGGNHTEELHEQFRNLVQYEELEFHNYWPLIGCRTEYYYRYSGTQTIPPCYGNFVSESRNGTNHWRVMKDPLRIHPRQLVELQRLTAERIAPFNSTVNACQPDTAADITRDTVDPTKVLDVNNARPLQTWKSTHFKTFCECKDWPSKWPEDRKWCEIEDITERFYRTPYNFDL